MFSQDNKYVFSGRKYAVQVNEISSQLASSKIDQISCKVLTPDIVVTAGLNNINVYSVKEGTC